MKWWDESVFWFNTHRAQLGKLVTFIAGMLAVLDKFYDLQILDIAIAMVAYVGAYLLGAGMAQSDAHHRHMQAYLREGVDRRRPRHPRV